VIPRRREGQVFKFTRTGNAFLIVGRTYHDESSQEVWLALDLQVGDTTFFSEDFLQIHSYERIL